MQARQALNWIDEMTTLSKQENWPVARVALQNGLTTIMQELINQGLPDDFDALRPAIRQIAKLSSQLDYLDSLEKKHEAIISGRRKSPRK